MPNPTSAADDKGWGLRDEFAVRVLPTVFEVVRAHRLADDFSAPEIVRLAYLYADACLAERQDRSCHGVLERHGILKPEAP